MTTKKLLLHVVGMLLIQYMSHAQGKVGINTTSPLAGLHVLDSSVLFSGTFSATSPGNPPTSGAGARMMWYPGKAALRVGKVDGTEWNKTNIGNWSFASGNNTIARGIASTAVGSGSMAMASYSFAAGTSEAWGDWSATFGSGNQSLGQGAFTINASNIAFGNHSVAAGVFTRSHGYASISAGYHTRARPYASLAIGQYNDTTALSTSTWNLLDPVFIIGNGSSNTNRSNALTVLKNGKVGFSTIAPAALLHAVQGSGGGLYSSSAMMILEDDNHFYVQLSAANGFESGILFGNESNAIRSAVVFGSGGSLDLRSGGNTTRLRAESDGDINLFNNELHSTATGEANLLPVCYGSVSSTSEINNGSGNFSVVSGGTGVFIISIDDIAYTSLNHTTVATANNSSARIINTSTSGNDLVIRIFDITGALVNNAFQFVVFEP